MHEQLKLNDSVNPSQYRDASFRFGVDCYQGKHTPAGQRELIESFAYLPFDGPIKLKDPDLSMCIFEEYGDHRASVPRRLHLGRWVATSNRVIIDKFNLKKRSYISRTSMDAELSLVSANLTLAAPGKLFYDPFVGTGSFSVTCAQFGATSLGSDIDGRSMRGSGKDCSLYSNFVQYGITECYWDSFVADLTHMPLRKCQLFDGIICDPPYGVREGPKTLGSRHKEIVEAVMVNGRPAHLYVRDPAVRHEAQSIMVYLVKKDTCLQESRMPLTTCFLTCLILPSLCLSTMEGCQCGCRRPTMKT